jgi:hypothetical protein
MVVVATVGHHVETGGSGRPSRPPPSPPWREREASSGCERERRKQRRRERERRKQRQWRLGRVRREAAPALAGESGKGEDGDVTEWRE